MARDYRLEVSARLASQLRAGVVPWSASSAARGQLPVNPVTGKIYRGGNALALLTTGQDDPRWCTARQAAASGWQVKPNELPTVVEFWQYADVVDRLDKDGNVERVRVPREKPEVRYASVFNAAQIDRIPELEHAMGAGAIGRAERILSHAGLPIFHDAGQVPCYVEAKDAIYLPPRDSFTAAEGYYSDAIRMLALSAMHPGRLNMSALQGDEASKTLTASLAAMIGMARIGGADQAAYDPAMLNRWAQLIETDKNAIYRCSREAERIAEFVLGMEREQSRPAGGLSIAPQRPAAFPTSETEAPMSGDASASSARRLPLYVPFDEIEQAKKAGARWDKTKRTWYAPPGVDVKPMARWMEKPRELTDSDILDQFADALRDAGLMLDGPPIMDGNWHRTPVDSAKNAKAKQGAYIGNLGDGKKEKPNGFIQNKLTGFERAWSAKGIFLTPEQRDEFDRAARESAAKRAEEVAASQEKAAKDALKRWDALKPATHHGYLDRKQVGAFGVRVDRDSLVIPIQDVEGKLWSLQDIPADSSKGKLYVKNGRKTGCFHVIGDMKDASAVCFAEGYATGASVHMATGLPVVIVFDSGNISPAMSALAPALEGKEKIICGDDDVLPPGRVLRRLNGMLSAEKTFEKLQLGSLDADELILDGVSRPAKHNPSCTVHLKEEPGPHGVPRIVGELRNSQTNGVLNVSLNNVGREKALAAAEQYGARAIFPSFASLDGGPTDFNDLHVREGLDVVKGQLGKTVTIERPVPRIVQPSPQPALRIFTPEPGGRYIGKIVAINETHLTQEIGRGIAVKHAREAVQGNAKLGASVEIAYSGGQARVSLRGRDDGFDIAAR
ncbi:DUF5710 domain-containing protein [Ralstonia insidiosa]|uniref:DUF1738 domain-containing protein n=1 Tax=Ralstonia insidiosa TaxID=190721 RepID=A0A848P2R5_9RALS|nr:ArdC-like ssDNA-binding domain-containing protein [Ralstonia insidiosa]NMV39930.1 DUF1738 domain-containing protein [Ralstonia insidiosa]